MSVRAMEGLNPEQIQAVEHFEGPVLVLAGAGSGKTRVLTTRIARLIDHHGVPPGSILAVTFTNRAAAEMRNRIRGLLGVDPQGLWMGTFHAIGARLLRRHAGSLGWSPTFTIADADQSLRRVRRVLEELNVDPRRWNPKSIRASISQAKNQLIDPARYAADHLEGFDPHARVVARVYPFYQEGLRRSDTFDFDDLLVQPVELFGTDPALLERYRARFSFLLVDEYQDTNRAQFRLLELLAGPRGNLMAVGDDDQSIYGWRGADLSNILDFEASFPGARILRLERNYRSSGRILEAANEVIRRNVRRRGKTLRAERETGELLVLVECADELDEAGWIATEIESRGREEGGRYRDHAVLYRTNAQSRALEDVLRRRGLPYQIVGGVRFYERREIQDLLAYLRLISNPRDTDAFERIVNVPRRGIGESSQARLLDWARQRGIGLLEAAEEADVVEGLGPAPVRAFRRFAEMIRRLSVDASRLPVGELLERVIDETGFVRALEEEGPEGSERIENVRELIAGAMEFDAGEIEGLEPEELDRFSDLDLFLQRVALVAEVDRHDPDADAITLMTLHNAKGLEFPSVFLAGLEEGLFPLGRAWEDPEQLEEERRLFYVGVTRAEDRLYLLHVRQRRRAGEVMVGRLSSFAEAIPDPLIRRRVSERLQRERGEGWGSRGAGFRVPGESPFARGARNRSLDPESGTPAGGPSFDDLSLDQDAPRFTRGERVRHATFGSGRIVGVSGFGSDLRVEVHFDSVGPKKLLVRYAGLEREDDGI